MRGTKAAAVDEDYEVGADAEESRPSGSEKPLSSRYRGVCWNRKNRRWQAAINSGGKYVYLGSFLSEYDAARAFDKAAVKLRGTRAKLNFPYSEYVDENGNLLEDPKMKNVMCKIEAIQGGASQGNGCGAANSGALLKSDPGADDSQLMPAEAAPLPLPLPATQTHEDVSFGHPAGGPQQHHRQMSPLIHGGGGSGASGVVQVKQQHACSSDGTKPPEWQGPRSGGTQQPLNLQLNLAAAPSGPQRPPQQQPQQQPQYQRPQPQAGAAVEPPLFPQFPDTVTTGGTGMARGGGASANCMARGPDGTVSAMAGPNPVSVASSVATAAPGARMLQAPPRGRAGHQPPSPLHHMYAGLHHGIGGPPGASMAGNGNCYEVPHGAPLLPSGHAPGAAPVLASAPPRFPNLVVQRTLLRELSLNGPSVTFLRFVNNQFKENPEDTVGVLYMDPRAPGRVGSAVWNGKCVIRMGMYDTERDACQASIRCMQLNCMFGIDQPRADMFNAMTDFTGPDVVDCASSQDHYDAMPPQPAPTQPQLPYSARSAPRGGGSGNGGMLLGDPSLDPHAHAHRHAGNPNTHPHHPGGAYGQRGSGGGAAMSYHGPDSSNVAAVQQPPQQAPPSPAGGGGGGAQGYGVPYDHQIDESGGAALQLANGAKQSTLIPLFEAMAQYRNANSGKAGMDTECATGQLQDNDGASGGGALSRRSLHGDYASLGELAHCHKRHVEAKRMRLDPVGGGGGGQLELRLEPPSREFHDAHKMPLPMVIKTWQQQQAAAGVL
ncbi:hypothetical protein Vretimale_15729 [Volvox reticuliferus]|uniref:AP2/ERF domain-containing protein n=2 Tax=Volvox reticuliferus TaxID=1737510 RepID=A0A8J4FVE3_9CHLO|nr:hypothetical protein Vretifemale_18350 [Volvox reticuliferus]GIM12391.1 hypothetical protein Vretimale_15729 [Volvox reticuliferus]